MVPIRYVSGEDGLITAKIRGVPGAVGQGRTHEEARENAIDVLRLMLAARRA